MRNEPLLTIKDLDVGYRTSKTRRIVAERLNLQLLSGELVCLIGPNGAGKSTLLRTLSGLQQPLSGEIYLANQKLTSLSVPDLARQLSIVLSERVEPGNLTVGDVVALGRAPYTSWFGKPSHTDIEKIVWSMEVTGTSRFRDKALTQLSDGEKQKVLLARALAQDTGVILLDEPTAHLDLPSRIEMMHLLRKLARETQKAILLSTHELDLALELADQLWVLHSSGTVSAGIPEQLILDGTFEEIFAGRGVIFDKSTGRFKTLSQEVRFSVALSGPPELKFWTSRALLRAGIGCSETDGRYQIEMDGNGAPQWMITIGQTQYPCKSLEELVSTLQLMEESAASGTFR